MRFAELIPVLQMAIGPVILISGIGLLLLSMTNRFGRVIDRARLVAEGARQGKSPRFAEQLKILHRRAALLRLAITMAAVSVLLAATLVMAIFVTAIVSQTTIHLVILFSGSMICLIASLIFFLQDLNLSLEAMKLDTQLER